MRRIHLTLPCLVLIAFAGAGVRASRADDSGSPQVIAHRAVAAAQTGRVDEIPALRQWLVESASRDDAAAQVARLAILDALIQMRSVEGPETVLPCLRSGGPEGAAAVVLVVRHATLPTLLAAWDAFDIGDRGHEESWLALGNALAQRRAAGFAFRLLARFEAVLRVVVADRTDRSTFWREAHGGVCGDGRLPIPAGFPPIAVYALWPDHIRGTPLLIDGPRPVRVSRVIDTDVIGFGTVSGAPYRDDARLEWIARLLHVGVADVGIAHNTDRTLGPLSDRTFLDDVGFARKGVMRKVEALADRLRQAGLVSEAERAAMRPRVRVAVADQRTNPVRPMATLPTEWTERPSPPPPPPPFPETPPAPRTPR